jgi:hypothetical protein
MWRPCGSLWREAEEALGASERGAEEAGVADGLEGGGGEDPAAARGGMQAIALAFHEPALPGLGRSPSRGHGAGEVDEMGALRGGQGSHPQVEILDLRGVWIGAPRVGVVDVGDKEGNPGCGTLELGDDALEAFYRRVRLADEAGGLHAQEVVGAQLDGDEAEGRAVRRDVGEGHRPLRRPSSSGLVKARRQPVA